LSRSSRPTSSWRSTRTTHRIRASSYLAVSKTEVEDVRLLHLVIAEEAEMAQAIVVTLYQPDPVRWEDDFRRRRS